MWPNSSQVEARNTLEPVKSRPNIITQNKEGLCAFSWFSLLLGAVLTTLLLFHASHLGKRFYQTFQTTDNTQNTHSLGGLGRICPLGSLSFRTWPDQATVPSSRRRLEKTQAKDQPRHVWSPQRDHLGFSKRVSNCFTNSAPFS